MEKHLKRWQGWLLFGGSMVVVFLLGLVASSLLERRAEVVSIFNNRKNMFKEDIVAQNEKFAGDFPREYETWKATEDTTFESEFNGSQHKDVLAQRPEMVILWGGYSFAWDYKSPRGHHHAIEDMREILRTGAPGVTPGDEPQPGTCWTCKGPDVPRLMKEKGVANFYKAKWSQWGPEVMNTIGCSDCHDARTMDLRPSRPALYEAWKRRGLDVSKASHQEMRSLVCAQCHTEYYFKGDGKYLTFPQDSGLTVENIEAYYDKTGYYDYIHQLSKAPILKAQHPGYELSKMGIHGQRGVSCADCHMPYISEGGVKYSDHHIMSPLAHIDRTCQTCHREDAETLRQNVYERQRKCNEIRNRVEKELSTAHIEAKFAWDKGASETEMKPILSLLRKSQWRWDFAVASHGASFHAPQEVMRILGHSLDYAHQARLRLSKVLAHHGFYGDVPMPDISTKEKAWAYLGIDGKQKMVDKKKFLQTIVPKWIQEAKKKGRFITL